MQRSERMGVSGRREESGEVTGNAWPILRQIFVSIEFQLDQNVT